MTHIWQTQTHGWWYLPLVRPFSRRYDYALIAGRALTDYGIEQQAEIVRHAYMFRVGAGDVDNADRAKYEQLLGQIVTRWSPDH